MAGVERTAASQEGRQDVITDCEVWLRRDYLLRHGITPDEPECGCEDCPTPADVTATEQRRLGEGDH